MSKRLAVLRQKPQETEISVNDIANSPTPVSWVHMRAEGKAEYIRDQAESRDSRSEHIPYTRLSYLLILEELSFTAGRDVESLGEAKDIPNRCCLVLDNGFLLRNFFRHARSSLSGC